MCLWQAFGPNFEWNRRKFANWGKSLATIKTGVVLTHDVRVPHRHEKAPAFPVVVTSGAFHHKLALGRLYRLTDEGAQAGDTWHWSGRLLQDGHGAGRLDLGKSALVQ